MTSAADRTRPDPQGSTVDHLWRYSAYEAVLTSVLMFGVATVVRWTVGDSPLARAVPGVHLKLVVVGVLVGILLSGLILSPLGKASGGHMNPAISLAMWRFGVFPGRGVLPYWAAQLAGSVLGVLLARLVWGAPVARPPVAYSALRPAPGWSNASLFAAETASMAVIVVLVGVFLSAPRLAPRVPWLVGGLIGVGIVALGTVTGPCVNPARQFGPAVLAGRSDFLATYLIAPMVGAVVAAVVLGRFHRCSLLTHRLCGPRPGTDAVQDERRSRHRG